MRQAILWPAAAAAAALPVAALADVITPLAYATVPVLPVIVIVEAVVFRVVSRRAFGVEIGFARILVAMAVANLASSLLGVVLPLSKHAPANLILVAIALLLSIVLEWAVCLPFFRRQRLGRSRLLVICLLTNLSTYVPIALALAFSPQPDALDRLGPHP
jgi:hypothetical protein